MAWFKRIFLFAIVNLLIILTITIVTTLLSSFFGINLHGSGYGGLAIMALMWGMGGSIVSLLISRMMAKWMMKVKLADLNHPDPRMRDVVAMVHRMARSEGISTMPQVGYYESPEVNAFATGPTKNRALVAVSTGLLERMSPDEVEGVIGHEVAHITNGDMVTMTLVQGIVNAFVIFFARVIAFAAANFVREEMQFMVRIAVTILLEIVLSFLGMIVVGYFSRMREFRADAGGARLAGRDKMIRALEKLQGSIAIKDPRDQTAIATMKISSKPGGIAALFSTHPPLQQRIARLKSGGAL